MSLIFSQTDQLSVEAPPERTVLQATLAANINHAHVCGGHARCSTCRVQVLEGLDQCQPRTEEERRLSERLGLPQNVRLACQTRINGDVSIRRLVLDDLDREIISRQVADPLGAAYGREREVAILVTDIVDYSRFAESFPAYDVVHVLNRYYHEMNQIIRQHRGIISDVAGDGILALFGAAEDSANPVLDAVNAVQAMSANLSQCDSYLNQIYGWKLTVRAGISFGSVVIGDFDTGQMKKIAAIGSAVNLASRIESANKQFGTKLLLSESAKDKVQGMVNLPASYRVELKGLSGNRTLFAVES